MFSCYYSLRTGWVRRSVEVVVTVDILEGYVCRRAASDALVRCKFIMAGEMVGPAMSTSGCGTALAARLSEVMALATEC